jgi:methylated-DNA-[protein]-cysteine S-methyltransferase
MSVIDDSHLDAVIEAPWPSRFNKLGIYTDGTALTAIEFLPSSHKKRSSRTELARHVVEQLQHYFHAAGYHFKLPLKQQGTPFQHAVWDSLCTSTAGEVFTYGELAARLDSGARAIGGACRSNPIPIIVPCHRVVARSGRGGYCGAQAGEMLKIKQWLLQHELGQA